MFTVKSPVLGNTCGGGKAGSGFDFSVIFQIDGQAENVRKGFCDMQRNQVQQNLKANLKSCYILHIQTVLFRFNASPKKPFVSCDCFCLSVCLLLTVSVANELNIQIKYIRKISICLLKYTLKKIKLNRPTLHCNVDNHVL